MVKVEGFEDMTADVNIQEAVVTYDPEQTTPEEMAQVITDETRFTATVK